MRVQDNKRQSRSGFTLVELLVVILIIAVLVSLLAGAVTRALGTANRTRNRAEIGQLASAVENFKAKFGIYPPSRIVLVESGDYTPPAPALTQLYADSVATLRRLWPRLAFPIDWNGNGTTTQTFVLYGDQCLVFFLGGIQDTASGRPACLGFSTSPTKPALPPTAANMERIGPFFEFESGRLRAIHAVGGVTVPFYSYFDTYGGAPYAYFSSYKTRNGYNRYLALGTSDCRIFCCASSSLRASTWSFTSLPVESIASNL